MNPTFKSACLFDITAAPSQAHQSFAATLASSRLPLLWLSQRWTFSFPLCIISNSISCLGRFVTSSHFSIKGEIFVYSTLRWMFYSIKHGFAVVDSEKKNEPPLSQNAIFLSFSFNFLLSWLPSHVFSCVGMTSESYAITSKHSLLAKRSL